MPKLRKDNHYVPKLYLKQWARDGMIPTYRLLVSSDKCPLWKNQTLKSIAFHQHLYTYFAGQEETDEFERWLDREFESPAEEAISRVVREQQMSPDHWNRLLRFAVAQDVRTPAQLREFLRRQNETLPAMLNEVVESSVRGMEHAVNTGIPLPQPKGDNANIFPLRVITRKGPDGDGVLEAKTVVGRRLWLWSVRHHLTSTLTRIPSLRWTILHAPAGISWPTSDNPLIRLNFNSAQNYDFDGGWGAKNGDILLPLSPKHLLYTCIGSKPPQRGMTLDEATARQMRKMIIEHADRYVFSQDPSDIHLVRPRKICADTFKNEHLAWKNWHQEQCEAEAELLCKPAE